MGCHYESVDTPLESAPAGASSDSPNSVSPSPPPEQAEAVRATERRAAAGWLGRFVGLVVAAVSIAAAVDLWFIAAAYSPSGNLPLKTWPALGGWHVTYESVVPELAVLLGAIGLAVLFATLAATVERVVLDRSRRSHDPWRRSLAPKVVIADTRGVFAGPVTVTVLIPAHNEEASIVATLESLQAQSRPPDRMVVVADNCTDSTVALARASGADVFETVGNIHKKAGALNQALKGLLDYLGDNDIVMCMDADTVLDEGFLAIGIQRFTSDRALMSVGGLFFGETGHGLLGQLQRNEYIRYSREIRRRRGRVFVLTGTASMFRPRALRAVAESRGRVLPGIKGDVYDTAALTEDNELTFAIKSLGGSWLLPMAVGSSPSSCRPGGTCGPSDSVGSVARWRTSGLTGQLRPCSATGPNSSASDTRFSPSARSFF